MEGSAKRSHSGAGYANYEAFKAHRSKKDTDDYSDILGSMFGGLGF